MDHLATTNIDKDMIDARTKFIRLATSPGGLAPYAAADKEPTEEVAAIRLVLNDFEFVSVSVQFGIMDYKFYHRAAHGTVKRYWTHAAPFIYVLRERIGSPTVYYEFEQLNQWVTGRADRPRRQIWWKKLF